MCKTACFILSMDESFRVPCLGRMGKILLAKVLQVLQFDIGCIDVGTAVDKDQSLQVRHEVSSIWLSLCWATCIHCCFMVQKLKEENVSYIPKYQQYLSPWEFLCHIITRDEMWVCQLTLALKAVSMKWKHTSFQQKSIPDTAGFRQHFRCTEHFASSHSGPSGHYCTVLQHMKEANQKKWSGWLTQKVILLHDNAHLYMTSTTKHS